MQGFTAPPRPADGMFAAGPLASLKPDAAAAALDGRLAVGNGVRHLAISAAGLAIADRLPAAAEAVLLPAGFSTLPPSPIYGRAPDAKPPAPRMRA